LDPAFEAAALLAVDFETDALALPVLAVAAARGAALVFTLPAIAVFFLAAGVCWPDAAAASASAAIDNARKRNVFLPSFGLWLLLQLPR
jgi:hypothetical protein